MHVNPSPVYPALQVQVKLPGLFVHTAFGSQGLFAHSSISVQQKEYESDYCLKLKWFSILKLLLHNFLLTRTRKKTKFSNDPVGLLYPDKL